MNENREKEKEKEKEKWKRKRKMKKEKKHFLSLSFWKEENYDFSNDSGITH